MKNIMLTALVIGTLFSCSQDTEIYDTTVDLTIPAITNIKTFSPDSSLDTSPRGKYIGIFGHYANRDLHGKIYINAGADTRYNAVIALVNGQELFFEGQSTRSEHVFLFEGDSGSFTANFKEYKKPIFTNVYIDGAEDESYIVAKKETEGAIPLIILGTFQDSNDANFDGNWDLMGDESNQQVIMVPTGLMFPFPEFVTAFVEDLDQLVISRTDNPTPFVINQNTDFGENAAVGCAQIPGFTIPTNNAAIVYVPETNSTLVSAGGQTSSVLGFDMNWTLNYTPEIAIAGVAESYVDNGCVEIPSGTWSYNGRTGTCVVIP